MRKQNATPIKNIEGRENQLVNLAVDEAERRLLNGTASSQIITTLLRFATAKARLEMEKLRSDIELQEAKRQEIADKATESEKYEEALAAFKRYKGVEDDEEDDEYN